MKIKKLFIVSVFILPMMTIGNAQANELKQGSQSFIDGKKDSTKSVQLAKLKATLAKAIKHKETTLKKLKEQKKKTLSQKKSLYRAKSSQAQYTLKREIKKIEHNKELSANQKSRAKSLATTKFNQVKKSIEKQKLSDMAKTVESFDKRIKKAKENLERRIQYLQDAVHKLQ